LVRKTDSKYKITFQKFREQLEKGDIPNNLLLFLNEKILLEDIINIISEKFIGSSEDSKSNVKHFFSDDKDIDNVISECSNMDFFTEKKVLVYKIVKKPGVRGIQKDVKTALLNYINNYNPDTVLMLVVTDKEYNLNNFKEFVDLGIRTCIIETGEESNIIDWIKEKLEGYKISEQTILYLLQFLNVSYDEINTEIEKLRTYCTFSKKITQDDVNSCVGISKDFNESDFIQAIFSRDKNAALKIYENLTLKEDVEIYLLVLLNSAYIGMSKMIDPKIKKLSDWDLRRELKLWYNPNKMLSIYKNYSREINELKIMLAFDYIYRAEKALKSTNPDKKSVFTSLINKLAGL
jgi:DNA polymerase III delta subunit